MRVRSCRRHQAALHRSRLNRTPRRRWIANGAPQWPPLPDERLAAVARACEEEKRQRFRQVTMRRDVVTCVPVSPEKPYGIDYSRTLHGPEGERLVGFDNAHPLDQQTRGAPQDHRHRVRSIRPYEYRDAASLLGDFWKTVDAVLRERGVIPCRH